MSARTMQARHASNTTAVDHVTFVFVHHKAGSSAIRSLLNRALHPGAFASRLQPPTILQLIANLSRKQLQRSGYF